MSTNLPTKVTGVILGLLGGLALASSVWAATGSTRTATTWQVAGKGGVGVIPYVGADKKYLWVDFEDKKKFDNVEYVYYNLNYTREGDVKGGVEGSFVPADSEYTGYYNGVPYFRKQILFGACSKGVCVYYDKVKDVKITVNTKMKTGKIDQYTQIITIPNDQF